MKRKKLTTPVLTSTGHSVPRLRHRKRVSGFCFICRDIGEIVSPLSMDLFSVAKEGEEITVVIFPSSFLPLGIVMNDEFDRKIQEWESKKIIF